MINHLTFIGSSQASATTDNVVHSLREWILSASGKNPLAERVDHEKSFEETTVSRLYSDIISYRSSAGRGMVNVQETQPKFELDGVSFWYPGKQALFDVTLTIPEKSVVALIGPSGCGKSTMLRLLNRMNDLIDGAWHKGAIRLDQKNIYDPAVNLVDLRRRVGMVFQKSNPFPKSIYENVVYGPRMAGMRDRARLDSLVERCLKQTNLWEEVKDRLHASAMEFSGGQQQRLCIARALATDPEVLLMDEPTSALDPASTAKIEDLIFELKKNYTIVIVTHNMQQAARVSDVTAFYFQGHQIESGPTDMIFTCPRVRQTEDYITGRFG